MLQILLLLLTVPNMIHSSERQLPTPPPFPTIINTSPFLTFQIKLGRDVSPDNNGNSTDGLSSTRSQKRQVSWCISPDQTPQESTSVDPLTQCDINATHSCETIKRQERQAMKGILDDLQASYIARFMAEKKSSDLPTT